MFNNAGFAIGGDFRDLSLALRLEGVDLGSQGQLRLSRVRAQQRRPERGGGRADAARWRAPGTGSRHTGQDDGAGASGASDRDGAARNKALIVFPAAIRWGRRLDRVFPRHQRQDPAASDAGVAPVPDSRADHRNVTGRKRVPGMSAGSVTRRSAGDLFARNV
jgi:hypothetical protein